MPSTRSRLHLPELLVSLNRLRAKQQREQKQRNARRATKTLEREQSQPPQLPPQLRSCDDTRMRVHASRARRALGLRRARELGDHPTPWQCAVAFLNKRGLSIRWSDAAMRHKSCPLPNDDGCKNQPQVGYWEGDLRTYCVFTEKDALSTIGPPHAQKTLELAAAIAALDTEENVAELIEQIREKCAPAEVPEFTRPGARSDDAAASVQGYRPADWFWCQHGIRPQRLSEASGAGKVKTVPAPKGVLDSQGRAVRTLYNEVQALKCCSPKRVPRSSRQKGGRANS